MPKLNITLEEDNDASVPVPLWFVQEMLNRKCDSLLVDHSGMSGTVYSVSDVEKLIQVSKNVGSIKDVKSLSRFITRESKGASQ